MDKSLTTYYLQFKESKYYLLIVYVSTIAICCLLILVLVLPLVQNLINVNQQVAQAQKEVDTLQANISFLKNLNDTTLTHEYTIANQAVPQTKDFAVIIQGVTSAAIKSNINLGDFNVEVGEVSKSMSEETQPETPYNLNISITGAYTNVVSFLTIVKQELPLMTVTSITYDGEQAADVTLLIPIQPFTNKNIDLSSQQLNISQSNQELLAKFDSWAASNVIPQIDVASASESGDLPPF